MFKIRWYKNFSIYIFSLACFFNWSEISAHNYQALINKHKEEIANKIKKEKLVSRSLAILISGAAAYYILPDNLKCKFNDFSKKLFNSKVIGVGNSVYNFVNFSVQLIALPVYNKLVFNYDINWIVNDTNIYKLLDNLKINSVNLDFDSDILKCVNIDLPDDVKIEPQDFNEIVKLKSYVIASNAQNGLSENQFKFYINNLNILLQKFEDKICKIIAFLDYEVENFYSKEDRLRYIEAKNLLLKLLIDTVNNCRSIISSISIPNSNKSGLLSVWFNFSNQLNSIIAILND